MKRKDWKDHAPGDLVRLLERVMGVEAIEVDGSSRYRAALIPGQLEVEFTNQTTRFTVIVDKASLRAHWALLDFLSAHSIHGVVSGYIVDPVHGLMQWFDIMPRYAADFVRAVRSAIVCTVAEQKAPEYAPVVPDGFIEALDASVWTVAYLDSHPALVNPGIALALTHIDGHTEVIFTSDGVWVGCWWPFEKNALVKMCQGMGKSRAMVDSGPKGWHHGHWDSHGAKKGVMYTKWEISMKVLASQLKSLKPKRRQYLPKPTHYSNTIH